MSIITKATKQTFCQQKLLLFKNQTVNKQNPELFPKPEEIVFEHDNPRWDAFLKELGLGDGKTNSQRLYEAIHELLEILSSNQEIPTPPTESQFIDEYREVVLEPELLQGKVAQGSIAQEPMGLPNCGNSCFINSALQVALNNPQIMHSICEHSIELQNIYRDYINILDSKIKEQLGGLNINNFTTIQITKIINNCISMRKRIRDETDWLKKDFENQMTLGKLFKKFAIAYNSRNKIELIPLHKKLTTFIRMLEKIQRPHDENYISFGYLYSQDDALNLLFSLCENKLSIRSVDFFTPNEDIVVEKTAIEKLSEFTNHEKDIIPSIEQILNCLVDPRLQSNEDYRKWLFESLENAADKFKNDIYIKSYAEDLGKIFRPEGTNTLNSRFKSFLNCKNTIEINNKINNFIFSLKENQENYFINFPEIFKNKSNNFDYVKEIKEGENKILYSSESDVEQLQRWFKSIDKKNLQEINKYNVLFFLDEECEFPKNSMEFKNDILNCEELKNLFIEMLQCQQFEKEFSLFKVYQVKVPQLGKNLAKNIRLIPNSEKVNSLIVKSGSQHSGHYWAYVKKEEMWYLCNDSSVTQIGNFDQLAKSLRPSLFSSTQITGFNYDYHKTI